MPRSALDRQLRSAYRQLARASARAYAEDHYDVADAAHELAQATLMLSMAVSARRDDATGVDKPRPNGASSGAPAP